MPVNVKQVSGEVLLQREQYQKKGVSRRYWDYKDNIVLDELVDCGTILLDAGCGEGILLEKLTLRFPNRKVIGFDYLQENIDICVKQGLNAQKMDIYHLEFPDSSIDGISFIEVIEHLEHPELAICELHRVLRPRGKLILIFPNDLSFLIARFLMLRFKELFYDPGHVRQWIHQNIRLLLEKNGFTIIRTRSIPFWLWPISLHGVVVAQKNS